MIVINNNHHHCIATVPNQLHGSVVPTSELNNETIYYVGTQELLTVIINMDEV